MAERTTVRRVRGYALSYLMLAGAASVVIRASGRAMKIRNGEDGRQAL